MTTATAPVGREGRGSGQQLPAATHPSWQGSRERAWIAWHCVNRYGWVLPAVWGGSRNCRAVDVEDTLYGMAMMTSDPADCLPAGSATLTGTPSAPRGAPTDTAAAAPGDGSRRGR